MIHGSQVGTTKDATVSSNGHEPNIEPLDPPHLTDMGNAQRFVRDHGPRVHYVHAWRTWLIWDGRRWARDETDAIIGLAKLTVAGIYAEAAYAESSDERKALARHATSSEAEPRLMAMVSLAESEPGVAILPAQLDADPWLFNVQNGTLDLRTGALRRHQPEDLITKLAPVAYEAAAECPRWLAFLKQILAGKQALIAFVQRMAGYALSGSTREQVFFILWGLGANGKTTLLTTVFKMVGDYARSTRPETFLVKRGDTIPNDIAALKGARLVLTVESSLGQRLAEGLVKQMTGGDVMTARFMRAEFFDFIPVFKVFFVTNHRPGIRGTEHAIWRRIRLIPFTVTIPDDEQDPDLAEKLQTEWPGILRWAVEGCLAWQRDGLGQPEEVRQATHDYRQDMDLLGDFLRDRCVIEPEAFIAAALLYEAYIAWCHTSGEKPISKRTFGIRLEERGFVSDRTKRERLWRGLRLATPGDASEPVTQGDASSGMTSHARAYSTNPEPASPHVTTRNASPEDEPEWVRE